MKTTQKEEKQIEKDTIKLRELKRNFVKNYTKENYSDTRDGREAYNEIYNFQEDLKELKKFVIIKKKELAELNVKLERIEEKLQEIEEEEDEEADNKDIQKAEQELKIVAEEKAKLKEIETKIQEKPSYLQTVEDKKIPEKINIINKKEKEIKDKIDFLKTEQIKKKDAKIECNKLKKYDPTEDINKCFIDNKWNYNCMRKIPLKIHPDKYIYCPTIAENAIKNYQSCKDKHFKSEANVLTRITKGNLKCDLII